MKGQSSMTQLVSRGGLRIARVLVFGVAAAAAAAQVKMPREDVIDVAAIGTGLCVHNMFQSNMVLQRGKPIRIWGWGTPGEAVVVSFGGETRRATAAPNRSWQVTFAARPANNSPAVMTIKGEKKTLRLDNILLGRVGGLVRPGKAGRRGVKDAMTS